jgi:hypothetical protein
MRVISFAFVVSLLTVATLAVPPVARAEQWNKETVVTFTSPVELPGRILPPGTYVFKLADNQWDRHLVQVFTQDQREVLASIQAIPDYRLQPAEKPVITLAERPAGQPEALQSWFYPGENYGLQFVYPSSAAKQAAPVQPEVASNADPAATIPPRIETAAPSQAELIAPAPPVMPNLANPDQETQVLAEAKVPQTEQLLLLPKTAGNFLVLPLLGVVFLSCGSMILYTVRQRI